MTVKNEIYYDQRKLKIESNYFRFKRNVWKAYKKFSDFEKFLFDKENLDITNENN